jgi:hypothetical protein
MQFSDELKDLCLETGGKQIKVTEDLEVFSYAKGVGEQQIKL